MAQRDLYQDVTNNVVNALEAGTVPWVKPWDGKLRNGASGSGYRGINTLLLGSAPYGDPRWYTYNQANSLGAPIRRGEKASLVVFWKFIQKSAAAANGEDKGTIPIIRHYNVFNHTQVAWPEGHKHAVPPPSTEPAFDKAQALLDAAAPAMEPRTLAAYAKMSDKVYMPDVQTFESPAHYWATLLHELVHWTGHKDRCDRDLSGRFGEESYGMEELVAELGAAFLCAELGLPGKLQHESYIGSWLRTLKKDKRAIFAASRLAQQAADYLLDKAGLLPKKGEEADE
jgi:antirestriction protein ArdC